MPLSSSLRASQQKLTTHQSPWFHTKSHRIAPQTHHTTNTQLTLHVARSLALAPTIEPQPDCVARARAARSTVAPQTSDSDSSIGTVARPASAIPQSAFWRLCAVPNPSSSTREVRVSRGQADATQFTAASKSKAIAARVRYVDEYA